MNRKNKGQSKAISWTPWCRSRRGDEQTGRYITVFSLPSERAGSYGHLHHTLGLFRPD
jgi:hypothetical protein